MPVLFWYILHSGTLLVAKVVEQRVRASAVRGPPGTLEGARALEVARVVVLQVAESRDAERGGHVLSATASASMEAAFAGNL